MGSLEGRSGMSAIEITIYREHDPPTAFDHVLNCQTPCYGELRVTEAKQSDLVPACSVELNQRAVRDAGF